MHGSEKWSLWELSKRNKQWFSVFSALKFFCLLKTVLSTLNLYHFEAACHNKTLNSERKDCGCFQFLIKLRLKPHVMNIFAGNFWSGISDNDPCVDEGKCSFLRGNCVKRAAEFLETVRITVPFRIEISKELHGFSHLYQFVIIFKAGQSTGWSRILKDL